VTIIDNLSNTEQSVYDRLCQLTPTKPNLVIGNLGDQSCLDPIFSSQSIDAVFHFGALKAV
jgi:UDP-glucose 4-epimerase